MLRKLEYVSNKKPNHNRVLLMDLVFQWKTLTLRNRSRYYFTRLACTFSEEGKKGKVKRLFNLIHRTMKRWYFYDGYNIFIPVRTQRCFDVYTMSITLRRRRMDVKMALFQRLYNVHNAGKK